MEKKMTPEDIKREFCRWVDAGRPSIWVRHRNCAWVKKGTSNWEGYFDYYIVDDRDAAIRKGFVDGEAIEYHYLDIKWRNADTAGFLNNTDYSKYRMKLKTKIKVGDWCIDPLKREPAPVTDVFYNIGLRLWMFSTNNNRDVHVVADFRPCTEPVYEWQWYCVDPNSKVVTLTHSHYVSNDSLKYGVKWIRLEDSKRVKEKVQ